MLYDISLRLIRMLTQSFLLLAGQRFALPVNQSNLVVQYRRLNELEHSSICSSLASVIGSLCTLEEAVHLPVARAAAHLAGLGFRQHLRESECIQGLILLLEKHTSSSQHEQALQEATLRALHSLAFSSESVGLLIAHHAPECLCALGSHASDPVACRAFQLLASVCTWSTARSALVSQSSIVPTIISIFEEGINSNAASERLRSACYVTKKLGNKAGIPTATLHRAGVFNTAAAAIVAPDTSAELRRLLADCMCQLSYVSNRAADACLQNGLLSCIQTEIRSTTGPDATLLPTLLQCLQAVLGSEAARTGAWLDSWSEGLVDDLFSCLQEQIPVIDGSSGPEGTTENGNTDRKERALVYAGECLRCEEALVRASTRAADIAANKHVPQVSHIASIQTEVQEIALKLICALCQGGLRSRDVAEMGAASAVKRACTLVPESSALSALVMLLPQDSIMPSKEQLSGEQKPPPPRALPSWRDMPLSVFMQSMSLQSGKTA